jgi:hypothetical protein
MGLFEWLAAGAPGAGWLLLLAIVAGFTLCGVADALARAVRRGRGDE